MEKVINITLMDRLYEFNARYIKRTKKELEKKTIEDALLDPPDYSYKLFEEISPEKCKEYALLSSLFIKGTVKKNSDTFRGWFELKRPDGIKMPQEESEIIRKFEKRTQMRKKFKIAGIAADIWGDGYLLIKFFEPDNEEKKNKLSLEVPDNAEPLDLILLDSQCITELYYPDKNNKTQIYYHYINTSKGDDYAIHPDRLLHIKTLELPDDPFGIAKPQILKNVLQSCKDIDVATGEILKWFSHGIQVLTKQGMTKAERDKALENLEKHPNYFAFSEKYTFDIKNPTAINPTPFYDHVTEAVSAVLCMPKQVLLGVQIGRVTGAEIGFADYYRDIKDNQDLVYSPLIERLYDYLGKSKGKDFFKYDLIWKTVYIDELAEADVLGKRVAAAVNARSSLKPIISIEEARKIISEGQIELDSEDVPEEEIKPIISPFGENDKNKETKEQPDNQERTMKPVTRETENKEMIKRLKDIIEKEKKLGEQILREQEEDK